MGVSPPRNRRPRLLNALHYLEKSNNSQVCAVPSISTANAAWGARRLSRLCPPAIRAGSSRHWRFWARFDAIEVHGAGGRAEMSTLHAA